MPPVTYFLLLVSWVGAVPLFSIFFTPELRSQYEQQQVFTNVLGRNLLGQFLNMLYLLLTNWCQGQNLMKSSEKNFQQTWGSQRCGPAVKPEKHNLSTFTCLLKGWKFSFAANCKITFLGASTLLCFRFPYIPEKEPRTLAWNNLKFISHWYL